MSYNPNSTADLVKIDGSISGAISQFAAATTASYSIIWPSSQAGAAGYALINDGFGNLSWAPAASGSVTSVGLADGSTTPIYTISGSPVTSAGTLTFSLANQSANKVFAGPSTGSAAQPGFRALVSADLPLISLTSGVSGILPISNGGTGANSASSAFAALSPITALGDLIVGIGANDPGVLHIGTTGQVLTVVGGTAVWANAASPLVFADSLVDTGGTVTLVGDNASPAASSYYGTNGSSVLGYHSLPVSGINQLTGDVTAGPGTGSQVATLTATTNATITTLSALTSAVNLGLSGSQISGGTFGVVNGSALTNLTAANLNGTVSVPNGGTGVASWTSNQIVIGGSSSTGALAQVAVGVSGQILRSNGTAAPTWENAPATGVVSVALLDASATPIYNISGSPVTSSGTLTFTLASQNANTVFAGPGSGSAAQPSFRALVAADIPSLAAMYVLLSSVGVANGVASLDSGGRIPISQLPNGVFVYKGLYDPSTNTPTLADGTGTAGSIYYVSTAFNGVVSGAFGGVSQNFQVGDLVIYNGTQWELTTPAAGVSSVNGQYGNVIVNAINQLTGDGTAGPATQSQSVVFTLATVNGNVGTFGGASSVPQFTVNGKGLITSVSAIAVVAPAGTLSGTVLNSTVVSSSLTSVGILTAGTWNASTITVPYGGTGATSFTAYAPIIGGTTTTGPLQSAGSGISNVGYVFTSTGPTSAPTWQAPATTSTATSEQLTLSSTDITNQYKDLAFAVVGSSPTANSIIMSVVGGPEMLKGVEYTVSLTGGVGGVTRITFAGDLATGGNSALVSGDILMLNYMH